MECILSKYRKKEGPRGATRIHPVNTHDKRGET